ncbi:MAG: YdeI/OmpD-associated family protein [Chitinophagales bacterium]|nr:YdeI/OmpD-associated family protein [Chitinophagales bacterium]
MALEITEVFYPQNRAEWRRWLEEHHNSKTEIWLRRFKKATNKPSISYDDLVEECLCFGWIDSVIKKLDEESNVQRITPRRKKKTFLSELNRQRVWKLQRAGLMTPAGIALIKDQIGTPDDPFEVPDWITEQLKEDAEVWENFQNFPYLYQRLKIGWIKEGGNRRREEAQRRLNYLIKMSRQNKMYGTIPIKE